MRLEFDVCPGILNRIHVNKTGRRIFQFGPINILSDNITTNFEQRILNVIFLLRDIIGC